MKTLAALIISFLLLLSLSVNLYYEFTNPRKVNDWYSQVLNENLGGLSEKEAFCRLSKYGFKIIGTSISPNKAKRIEIAPPYDLGIIGLLQTNTPFNYIVEINPEGVISSYGLLK